MRTAHRGEGSGWERAAASRVGRFLHARGGAGRPKTDRAGRGDSPTSTSGGLPPRDESPAPAASSEAAKQMENSGADGRRTLPRVRWSAASQMPYL